MPARRRMNSGPMAAIFEVAFYLSTTENHNILRHRKSGKHPPQPSHLLSPIIAWTERLWLDHQDVDIGVGPGSASCMWSEEDDGVRIRFMCDDTCYCPDEFLQ